VAVHARNRRLSMRRRRVAWRTHTTAIAAHDMRRRQSSWTEPSRRRRSPSWTSQISAQHTVPQDGQLLPACRCDVCVHAPCQLCATRSRCRLRSLSASTLRRSFERDTFQDSEAGRTRSTRPVFARSRQCHPEAHARSAAGKARRPRAQAAALAPPAAAGRRPRRT